jgi:hypothetical protein
MVLSLITTLRIVPDHNIEDDPHTWSPLSEIEEATNNVVIGRVSGLFSFVRASREDMALEVEDPPLYSSYEQGESSRMRSVIVGSLSLPSESALANDIELVADSVQSLQVLNGTIPFLPNSGSFPALIRFLNDKIYKKVLCLTESSSDLVNAIDSAVMLASILENLSAKVWKGLLMLILSPHSLLNYARALELKRAISPLC